MLHISIPILDELENLPQLLNCLRAQTCQEFIVWICVNQPEEWWDDPEKEEICFRNKMSLDLLENVNDLSTNIIDKSSRGKGWIGKNHGVGFARKTLFDAIESYSSKEEITISLDADTIFNPDYFQSVLNIFDLNKDLPALSIPYYHPLTGNKILDRAILHYEIYMRYYALNLYRIESPYCFTALGSAIAFRMSAYRRIGGITPKMSGEDFYFLQKMVKFKPILNYCDEKVFPAARFSNRVYFGTGPAMIRGALGDWESYPIYDYRFFDTINRFYNQIPDLFLKDEPTELDDFLLSRNVNLWQNLRVNNKSLLHFRKAVHDNFDGLRILQFLKTSQQKPSEENEERLIDFLSKFCPKSDYEDIIENFSFESSDILQLNRMRDYLCKLEDNYRLNEFKKRK